MEIAEFLLARIAEDETLARVAADPSTPALWLDSSAGDSPVWLFMNHYNPARALAECEARRRIVAETREWLSSASGWRTVEASDEEGAIVSDHMLRFLALPYADHPDYRSEWKP